MNNTEKLNLLIIGKTNIADSILNKYGDGLDVKILPFDLDGLIDLVEPLPSMIFCNPPPEEIPLLEIAQTLRMAYPGTPIYFIGLISQGYHKGNLLKNGFTDIYLLPLDKESLSETLNEAIESKKSKGKIFRTLQIIDIDPNIVLNFDTYVYLPQNKKYVLFTRAGEPLGEKKAKELLDRNIGSLKIPKEQLDEFYNYTADNLNITSTNMLSETEKREKLKYTVRDIFSGMFSSQVSSFQTGKKIVDDLRDAVKTYILNSDSNDWFKRINSAISDSNDSYSHAASTASFAALFSLGIGIGDASELAIAALLHDIGWANVPTEILDKPDAARNEAEKREYEKHPEYSVKLIQSKKLVVNSSVYKIVLQHHEKNNRQGFPNRLGGTKILPEAQILAIADRFEELTTVTEGKERTSLPNAIKIIQHENLDNRYDPIIFDKIMRLFPKTS
jgi:HD-GYP domain-containing protein (c-di-GMP phosphodiesterase class II)